MRDRETKKFWIHRLAWILFIVYIAGMAYFLFFSEEFNRSNSTYRYNLVLLQEIKRGIWCFKNGMKGYFFLNVVMNVVAFMPFGFILPIISPGNRKFLRIFLRGFLLTLVIETMQLFLKVGCFDLDDMLLNTIGAVLGYFLFWICKCIGKRKGWIRSNA